MKRTFRLWQIGGFLFTGIAGVLLHFLYDWTNKSILVAPFSAVNESIWEHMKLLFFPMLIFALVEYAFIGKSRKCFGGAKLAGTLIGLLLIPIIYYTYTGVFGVNADWFNIVIFFIAAGAAYYSEALFLNNEMCLCKSPKVAFTVMCAIGILFIVLTFIQPKIPLFRDPVTGTYGV